MSTSNPGFDFAAAQERRAKSKRKMTVFDTGERLEPMPWHEAENALRDGPVDFEDEGGTTIFTVEAMPSAFEEQATVLDVSNLIGRLEFHHEGALMFVLEENGEVSLP